MLWEFVIVTYFDLYHSALSFPLSSLLMITSNFHITELMLIVALSGSKATIKKGN